jgi:hypothetical protein
MRQHWLLPAEQDLSWTGPEWLLLLVHNNSLEVLANLFMLLWHTWNIRNKMIHEGIVPFIARSVTFLTRYMHSLLTVRQQGDVKDLKGKRYLQSVSASILSSPMTLVAGTRYATFTKGWWSWGSTRKLHPVNNQTCLATLASSIATWASEATKGEEEAGQAVPARRTSSGHCLAVWWHEEQSKASAHEEAGRTGRRWN